MLKISLDTVKSLINYLKSLGLDRQTLLSVSKQTEQSLNVASHLIDASHYEKLLEHAETNLDNKSIGFEFGQHIEADRWGVLGYIAYTSETLKDALLSQQKYQSLVGNVGIPATIYSDNNVTLKWIPAYKCSYHLVEEIITGWTTMARNLTIYPIELSNIYFTHSCPTDIDIYKAFFGCDVHFDSEYNGVKFNKSLLRTPLSKYDAGINHQLSQYADNLLDNLVQALPVQTLTQYISNHLPFGVPEIEDAALNHKMSVRTLQRKLGEYNLTFSGLIDATRKNLAMSYLANTSTKIIQISEMLGFSEQSAFQRAFKRWTGKTPKQFRDNDNHSA